MQGKEFQSYDDRGSARKTKEQKVAQASLPQTRPKSKTSQEKPIPDAKTRFYQNLIEKPRSNQNLHEESKRSAEDSANVSSVTDPAYEQPRRATAIDQTPVASNEQRLSGTMSDSKIAKGKVEASPNESRAQSERPSVTKTPEVKVTYDSKKDSPAVTKISEIQEEYLPKDTPREEREAATSEPPREQRDSVSAELNSNQDKMMLQLKRKFIDRLLSRIRPQKAVVQTRRGPIAAVATTSVRFSIMGTPGGLGAGPRTSIQGGEGFIFSGQNTRKNDPDTSTKFSLADTEATEGNGRSPSKENAARTSASDTQRASDDSQKAPTGGFFSILGIDPATTQSILRDVFKNLQPEITKMKTRQGQYAPVTTLASPDKGAEISSQNNQSQLNNQNKPTEQRKTSEAKPVPETNEVNREKLRKAVDEIKPETAEHRYKMPQFADHEYLPRSSAPQRDSTNYDEEEKVMLYRKPHSPEHLKKYQAYNDPEDYNQADDTFMSQDEISMIREIENDVKSRNFYKRELTNFNIGC